MKTPSKLHPSYNPLPIKHTLTFAYIISLLIALLMTIASLAGLLYKTNIYPTEELQQSFLPTDVINLFIGLPILLVSLWFTRKGKLISLLFWPGALMFVLYHYIAYLFGMPLNAVYMLYLLLAALSVYTLIGLVASIDGKAVQEKLTGVVPERFAGGVLVGFGVAFSLRVIVIIANSLITKTSIATAELPAMIADFLICPAWAIGGVQLWRRKALGYVAGLGLLFQGSMLFIGLIIFLFLKPILTAAQFSLTDIIVVALMGLIAFIPTGLFMRGVLK